MRALEQPQLVDPIKNAAMEVYAEMAVRARLASRPVLKGALGEGFSHGGVPSPGEMWARLPEAEQKQLMIGQLPNAERDPEVLKSLKAAVLEELRKPSPSQST